MIKNATMVIARNVLAAADITTAEFEWSLESSLEGKSGAEYDEVFSIESGISLIRLTEEGIEIDFSSAMVNAAATLYGNATGTKGDAAICGAFDEIRAGFIRSANQAIANSRD